MTQSIRVLKNTSTWQIKILNNKKTYLRNIPRQQHWLRIYTHDAKRVWRTKLTRIHTNHHFKRIYWSWLALTNLTSISLIISCYIITLNCHNCAPRFRQPASIPPISVAESGQQFVRYMSIHLARKSNFSRLHQLFNIGLACSARWRARYHSVRIIYLSIDIQLSLVSFMLPSSSSYFFPRFKFHPFYLLSLFYFYPFFIQC